jgi:5'-deoxynucleotidase YfbR-like HD superfamily hydrolase
MDVLIQDAQETPLRAQQEAKREEAFRRELFEEKARRFVKLWDELVDKFSKNESDVKLAQKASKAFHDLERSEGWAGNEGKR